MLGSTAFNEYHMVADIGTTLSIGIVLFLHVLLMYWPGYFLLTSPVREQFTMVGELGSGTKALNFLIQNFLRQEDELTKINDDTDAHYAAIADKMAAESPVGSNGVIFMPWIFGSSLPEPDANMKGGFINLSPLSSRNDLIRAVFESYALTLKWWVQMAESKVKRKIKKIQLIGGGALWETSTPKFVQMCCRFRFIFPNNPARQTPRE